MDDGRHTTRATAVIQRIRRPPHAPLTAVVQSLFPFNLKRDIFRAKNQYDKMEEKKLCGAGKTIYLNRRTRACGAKKRMYQNGRINVSKQKKN